MIKRILLILLLCLTVVACGETEEVVPVATPVPPTAVPPTATPAPRTAEAGVVLVDPHIQVGTVSDYFLGSNHGPWTAVPANMIEQAYDSGIQSIRFPGGEWGDANKLRSYQIDPFMDMVEQIGAYATINTNLREGTIEQAVDLLTYVNIENEYGVQYWAIGNEPTLYAGALQVAGTADDYETEQFNREWREYAIALKEIDPSIKVMGPEIHQFNDNYAANPKDSSGLDWMTEFLEVNGDLVDVVTFHRYPFGSVNNGNATVADLRHHLQEWDRSIPYLRGLIQEITGRDIPIAITEVNTHFTRANGTEATPDSHYNAIWLAEMYGRLMYQDVFMVNHWIMAAPSGNASWGIVSRGGVRPSYYTFQLFKQFGAELLHVDSGVEGVSVYASRRDDGALTVLVVNTLDEAQGVQLDLGADTAVSAELFRLDQTQNPDEGTAVMINKNDIQQLPAQSISLFVIDG